mgnify:CR=1 FL=1
METKDLRYAPAQYTREHQRAYTVLDIAEGDSTIVTLSQALQYSDAVRAYDCSTLEDTAVTDAVSKWILQGDSIWDTFEYLRLPVQVVDSQRIALPDGFVGRALIARVTPDADAEAPELIRLGALLHRIQQEPTALWVWKNKVKVEKDTEFDYGYSSEPSPPEYPTPPVGTYTEKVIPSGTVPWKVYGSQSDAELQALGYTQDIEGHWRAVGSVTKLIADRDAPPYYKGQFLQYVDANNFVVRWAKVIDHRTLVWKGYWVLGTQALLDYIEEQ